MKNTSIIMFILLLLGCSTSPPPPPSVEGEYRPINRVETLPAMTAAQSHRLQLPEQTFDFSFEGDIVDALYALQKQQPEITVRPPLGQQIPLLVRLDLRATTLDDALRAIGDQGGKHTDVIMSKDQATGSVQVFVRFNTIPEIKQ